MAQAWNTENRARSPVEGVHAVRSSPENAAAAPLPQGPQVAEAPLLSSLSKREFQVFCRLSGGSSITAIAAELNLSAKSVSTYRARLLEKMGCSSTDELITYVRRRLDAARARRRDLVGGTGIEPVASTV